MSQANREVIENQTLLSIASKIRRRTIFFYAALGSSFFSVFFLVKNWKLLKVLSEKSARDLMNWMTKMTLSNPLRSPVLFITNY